MEDTDRVDVVRVGGVRGGEDGGEVSLPGGREEEAGQGGGGPVSLQGQSQFEFLCSIQPPVHPYCPVCG